jgi:hypothetical protein
MILVGEMDMAHYSSETYKVLRSCDLDIFSGLDFIRCRAENLQQAARVVKEVAEEGVFLSWHDDFGDYVQVKRNTKTYRLICQLKS